MVVTLPQTNIFSPENGCLEYDCFLLRAFRPIFISFREGTRVSIEVIVTIVSKLVYFTYLRDASNLLIKELVHPLIL